MSANNSKTTKPQSGSAIILQQINSLTETVNKIAKQVEDMRIKQEHMISAFTELETKVIANTQNNSQPAKNKLPTKRFPTINQWFKQMYRENPSAVENYLSKEKIEQSVENTKQAAKYKSWEAHNAKSVKQQEKKKFSMDNLLAQDLFDAIKLNTEMYHKLVNDHKQEKSDFENSHEEVTKE